MISPSGARPSCNCSLFCVTTFAYDTKKIIVQIVRVLIVARMSRLDSFYVMYLYLNTVPTKDYFPRKYNLAIHIHCWSVRNTNARYVSFTSRRIVTENYFTTCFVPFSAQKSVNCLLLLIYTCTENMYFHMIFIQQQTAAAAEQRTSREVFNSVLKSLKERNPQVGCILDDRQAIN